VRRKNGEIARLRAELDRAAARPGERPAP